MTLIEQKKQLKLLLTHLKQKDILVSGVYSPSDQTDGGIEINNRYIVQLAPYHNPIFIIDEVAAPGNEIASFNTVTDVVAFFSEKYL